MREVTLYAATGCHLCERAREELEPLRAELGFTLVEVDIGASAELERRYRPRIPVIELDGSEVSHFRLDEPRLRSLLGAPKAG